MEADKPAESQSPPAATAPTADPSPDMAGPTAPPNRKQRLAQWTGPTGHNRKTTDTPSILDASVPVGDLRLEYAVRVWSRERELVGLSRQVDLWRGSRYSGTHRYLATQEILEQLKAVVRSIETELHLYTAEVETPARPARPTESVLLEDAEAVNQLNPEYHSAPAVAPMPIIGS